MKRILRKYEIIFVIVAEIIFYMQTAHAKWIDLGDRRESEVEESGEKSLDPLNAMLDSEYDAQDYTPRTIDNSSDFNVETGTADPNEYRMQEKEDFMSLNDSYEGIPAVQQSDMLDGRLYENEMQVLATVVAVNDGIENIIEIPMIAETIGSNKQMKSILVLLGLAETSDKDMTEAKVEVILDRDLNETYTNKKKFLTERKILEKKSQKILLKILSSDDLLKNVTRLLINVTINTPPEELISVPLTISETTGVNNNLTEILVVRTKNYAFEDMITLPVIITVNNISVINKMRKAILSTLPTFSDEGIVRSGRNIIASQENRMVSSIDGNREVTETYKISGITNEYAIPSEAFMFDTKNVTYTTTSTKGALLKAFMTSPTSHFTNKSRFNEDIISPPDVMSETAAETSTSKSSKKHENRSSSDYSKQGLMPPFTNHAEESALKKTLTTILSPGDARENEQGSRAESLFHKVSESDTNVPIEVIDSNLYRLPKTVPEDHKKNLVETLGQLVIDIYKSIGEYIFNENNSTETNSKEAHDRRKRSVKSSFNHKVEDIGKNVHDISRFKTRTALTVKNKNIRSYTNPYSVLRSLYGVRYPVSISKSKVRYPNHADRFLVPRDLNDGHTLAPSPVSEKIINPKLENSMNNLFKTRSRHTLDPSVWAPLHIFKRMKKKMNDKRKFYSQGSDFLNVVNMEANPESIRGPTIQFRCKTGTKGVLTFRDGRTVSSKGLSYSADNGSGIKSLICQSETSDITKSDEDTMFKKAVSGLNVITTDYDPFKFLEHDNNIDQETLEIGSKTFAWLDSSSNRNQTVSSVGTEDKEASSLSRTSAKFIYDGGARTAFETAANVEGTATFNSTDGQNPLVLASKLEESSSIVQNPKRYMEENKSRDTEDVATLINYDKKTDFTIAFRNSFN